MADDDKEVLTAAETGDGKDILKQMEQAVPHASSSGSDEKIVVQQPEQKSEQNPEEKKKGPSKLKQLWDKAGLDWMTLQLMFKGSLPPVIGIAMYQSKKVQAQYQTVGYLVAISSILGFAIMPRGKFIQHITLATVSICLAAAINLLALYCVTQARLHTTPPGTPAGVPVYNSSASAVCAIWLILQVYLLNVLKAARPQFQFPSILCTIFVCVSLTYGVIFPDMPSAISFMERLLEAFLTGFALATGVSLFVFPISSRMVVMKEMNGYLMLLNGSLKMHTAYMASLETFDPAAVSDKRKKDAEDAAKSKHHHKRHEKTPTIMETPVLVQYRALQEKLLDLHGKLNTDVTPAKREFAIGKLESHDLTMLWKLMSSIFLPVIGLSSMINILERQAEVLGWAESEGTEEQLQKRHEQVHNLHFLLKELHAPFASMTGTIGGAFQHVLLVLELVKPPKKKPSDEESKDEDEASKPGSAGFAEAYKKKVDEFYASKQQTLRDWCNEHGVDLPDNFFDSNFKQPEGTNFTDEDIRERYQRQLFMTLYLEYLLWRVSSSLLELVLYVDKRKADGIFDKRKLIFPGSRTLYKWVQSALGREDLSEQDSYTYDIDVGGGQTIYLGQEFGKKKDPEHCAPRNTAEKIGDTIRLIPKFLRSEVSAFGFRVVLATMSVAIICYLEASQTWFLQNRLLWAMIMIAMSMTRTAGQSINQFILRIAGTFIAMVGAFTIWYIVDGKIPGVIVFLWLWIFVAYYFVLKMPKMAIVAILSLVTAILIIGYELQVRAIGVELATSNGQPAYKTYLLAPYRLGTVAGGLFVAFIWTIFPYPISESSELRKDLSAALYLMSSFYSIVHETVSMRILDTGGDHNTKGTHAYNLEKARSKTFVKLIALLNSLKMNAAFSKFQVRVGGRFPAEEYEELMSCIRRLMLWTSLASYASMTFETSDSPPTTRSTWSADFRYLLSNANVTSNRITSVFSLLSSSLSNAQPLPPYLELPEPFQFVKRLESIDRDILSIRHIAEPEYSAFAVMQVAAQSINSDMTQLVEHVKNLVGEIDFSFHALSSSSVGSEESLPDSSTTKSKAA